MNDFNPEALDLELPDMELPDMELDEAILETPARKMTDPPPGMFALSKNHFLQQFHAAKGADKSRRRGVKRFIRPENAKQLKPFIPSPGDCTHAVVRGDFILGEIIPVLMRGQPAELLAVATLGMSEGNARMLADLRDRGQIRSLRVVVSHYFASVDATSTFARVNEILGESAPAVTRNHAKVILIRQPPDYFTVAGSANLRSSDNVEQFSIWNDREVLEFHLGWINEL